MPDQTPFVETATAALVPDQSYRDVVSGLITRAANHCLASLFIVDPDPLSDTDLVVDALLHDLAGAAWRGADARLLIGGSRGTARIRDVCLLARARAQSLGIPTRLLAATEQRSDHAKIVVADDAVLLGSHNWSPGALTGQTQDSTLIRNTALAGYFVTRFETQWLIAREEGFDAPV